MQECCYRPHTHTHTYVRTYVDTSCIYVPMMLYVPVLGSSRGSYAHHFQEEAATRTSFVVGVTQQKNNILHGGRMQEPAVDAVTRGVDPRISAPRRYTLV